MTIDTYKLCWFLRGLMDKIWLSVRMFESLNLSTTNSLAKIYKNQNKKKKHKFSQEAQQTLQTI